MWARLFAPVDIAALVYFRIDLLVVALLLWRRTRALAFAAAVFHLMNAYWFRIGIFPWFMIAATMLFFPPDWPRVGRFRRPVGRRARPEPVRPIGPGQRATVALLAIYLTVQLLVPLRRYLYPGNVNWTEQGQDFAWHMMLRDKRATAQFYATDPVSQRTGRVNPRKYLTDLQLKRMTIKPDMILQFSHHVAEDLRRKGYPRVEVRAWVAVSLNGREPQLLVDPRVNMAAESRTLWPASWILPLEKPLPDRAHRGGPPAGPSGVGVGEAIE